MLQDLLLASRYQVVSRLGQGGMATVYRAHDTQDARDVALKVMSPELADDADAQRRFKAEHRVLAALDHPGVPFVQSLGLTPDGLPYFAMELVEGESLEHLGALDPDEVRALLIELLPILAHVHRRGLIHADLKGENLMRDRSDRLKLMDFGLAGPAGPRGIEGTVTHLAPELIQRGSADQRADLYALGVIAYRWLTGELPFALATPGETLKAHLETAPVPPSRLRGELDASWDALVLRLLAKRPSDRFQSALEVLRALGVESEEDDSLAMPLEVPFVGHAALLTRLSEALGLTACGQRPAPAMITGGPGLGKTRLLAELGTQARLLDLACVAGSCPADAPPFGVWIDLSRELLALGRQHAPDQAEALRALLAPLIQSEAGEAPADAVQALSEAFAALIEAITQQRGLVLTFDDWHAADAGSKTIYERVRTQLGSRPVFWVLAGADEAEGALVLAPLERDELAELVAAALGVSQAPESVVAQVFEASGGNPRFAEDLLRYLLSNKQLVRRQSGWTLVEGAAGELPRGLQALYEARLRALSEEGQALAHTLAVSGAPLAHAALAAAAALAAEALERAQSELLSRGVARESDSGLGLADQQFAAHLASALAPAARAERHGAIARALAATSGPRPGLRVLNALARHGLAGPAPEQALGHAIEAARQNLALRALADAKRFAEAARSLSSGLSSAERLEVLELLVSAHRGLDEADAARAVAEEAVALAESLGDPALTARSLNGLGKIHQLASRYDEARAAFERAADAAGTAAPLEVERSHRARARLAFFEGELDAMVTHARTAIGLLREHGQPAERASALAELGELFQGDAARMQEGLGYLEEALAIARSLDDPHLESLAVAGLGNLQLALGQLAAARESFERAAGLFEAIGNAGEGLFARLNLALVAEEQGHFAEAEAYAARAAAEARALNRKFPLGAAMAAMGAAQVHQGRTQEGLKLLAEAAALAEEIGHKYLRAIIRQLEAPVRVLLGQWDAARTEAEALASFAAAAGAEEMAERAGLVQAELAMHAGHPADAATALEPLTNSAHGGVRARSRVLLAGCAIADHDAAGAYQAVHAARKLLAELGAPRVEAELRLAECALAVLESDDPTPHAEEAARLLEAIGQRHVLALALDYLARFGPQKTRRANAARARELVRSLSLALGPDEGAYLDAFDRARLVVDESEPAVLNPSLGGPVPTTLSGLRDLARRLEAGLAHAEANGSLLGAGQSTNAALRLEQIVSFARAVNSTLDLDTVIDRALSLVIEITGAERGLLLLQEAGQMSSTHYLTAPGCEDAASGEQYSRSVAREVLNTGETVCVLDALSDQRFAQAASVMGMNLQTIICVPLKEQGVTIGAIYVDRQGLSDQFSASDLEIVQALAGLTAQAIVNARLMEAQRARQLELEMLNRLSRSISRTLELDKVLDIIADMTTEVNKGQRVFLLMLDRDGQLSFGAGRDSEGPLPPSAARDLSHSICAKVLETQHPVHVAHAPSHPEFGGKQSIVNLQLGTIMCVPLVSQSGLAGVLYVDGPLRAGADADKELSLLTAIANTASLAVENAKLYRQATIDGLTGLYVRSFFMHRLEEEIRRSQRFGNVFSLLVMDVDHFKKFNDAHGHAVGDQVLKLVANTIKLSVRTGLDLPCRYGGEEMVVLLPETDTTGALVTAERIRTAIQAATLASPSGEPLHVTISIGVATFPDMAGTAAELFERADQALYRSKHGGRNRTTVYAAEMNV